MPVYKLFKNNVVVNTIIADEVESIRDEYDLIEEVIPEPVVVEPGERLITSADVRGSMNLTERTTWDNESTPTVKTAKIEFESPRNVADSTEILDFMVQSGDISTATRDKILS